MVHQMEWRSALESDKQTAHTMEHCLANRMGLTSALKSELTTAILWAAQSALKMAMTLDFQSAQKMAMMLDFQSAVH